MTITLIIILFLQIKFSGEDFVYSEPEWDIKLQNQKFLRGMCGLLYKPRILHNKGPCFHRYYWDRYWITPREIMDMQVNSRVLGGRDVTNRESPWTVQIANRRWDNWNQKNVYGYECTGVLISMKHIVTAAHCWKDDLVATIFAGNDIAFDNVWSTEEFTLYRHPDYKPKNDSKFDIAVIVLKTAIDWQKYGIDNKTEKFLINPICLPKPETEDKLQVRDLRPATFFGWGRFYQFDFPNVLQRADLNVKYHTQSLNQDQNDKELYFFMSEETERHTPRGCKADSGSGLVQYTDRRRAVLIGIVISLTKKFDKPDDPPCTFDYVGFTTILRIVPHLKWIKMNLKK